MRYLASAVFLFMSLISLSQSYDYGLWLVDTDDNQSLNATQQTYNVTEYTDSIVIENPALRISFTKAGVGVLIPTAEITFADDVIICPIEYYEEYPRWMVIIFKPTDAPETRYWLHWHHFNSMSPYKQ